MNGITIFGQPLFGAVGLSILLVAAVFFFILYFMFNEDS
jgi:hypothetical protein